MTMPLSPNLQRLIATNAPLWAGEAEIVRTYWTSPIRTRETDKLWLRRQCWKEYVGDTVRPGNTLHNALIVRVAEFLQERAPQLDVSVERHDILERLEQVHIEYSHYVYFSDVYDSILEPGEAKLNANELTVWPEETALAKRRVEVKKHAKLAPAAGFTEGGYCTMYSEGAKLIGRPGVDGRIGIACKKVYDDEFGHMMHGVVGIEGVHDLTPGDWRELTEVTSEILRLRLYMRNAQFSQPLSDARIAEIVAGKIEPIAFDYQRAETYLQAGGAH
jgi:hypothetical protein